MDEMMKHMMKAMMYGDSFSDFDDFDGHIQNAPDKTNMSREDRIQRHEQEVDKCKSLQEQGIGITRTHNSIQKQSRTSTKSNKKKKVPPISSLNPIAIADLKVRRTPYNGQVLYCKIATRCIIMASAMILVEDLNGDLADVAVYNLNGNPDTVLRKGRHIAIIEPFFKERADGSPGIRIDNPKEIIFDVKQPLKNNIEEDEQNKKPAASSNKNKTKKDGAAATTTNKEEHPQDYGANLTGVTEGNSKEATAATAFPKPSKAPHIQPRQPEMHQVVVGKEAIKQRESGNEKFKASKFDEAIEYYSKAINAIKEKKDAVIQPSAIKNKGKNDDNKNQYVELWVFYSNRSMAYLKIGKPQLAFQDATMSHSVAPMNATKPILRCAQCLAALSYRESAIKLLQQGENEFSEESNLSLLVDLRKQLEKVKILKVGKNHVFKSIAEALSVAPPGAEIQVDAGVYMEPLHIYKPVTIRSVAPLPPDLVSVEETDTLMDTPWAEIHVAPFKDAIKIDFYHRGLEKYIHIVGFRIVSEGFRLFSSHAISVDGKASAVLVDCAITSTSGPVVCASDGAQLHMDQCAVYDGAQGGILVADGATAYLKNVQICYNAASGLELRTNGQAILDNCIVFANGRQGIVVWHQAGSFEAKNSQVHSHDNESGVLVAENIHSEAIFTSCKVFSNDFAGIAVEVLGMAKIINCEIYNNHEGILIQDSASCLVKNCNVYENGSNGIFVGYDHVGSASLIKNNVHHNQFKGIMLGGGKTRRVILSKNIDKDNFGMPSPPPKSLIRRLTGEVPTVNRALRSRRWAKNVKKNSKEEKEEDVKPSPAASFFEAMFDDVNEPSKSANVVLGCANCEMIPPEGTKFLKCSKCKAVCYCSEECQRVHWKAAHKKVCKAPGPKYPAFVDNNLSV